MLRGTGTNGERSKGSEGGAVLIGRERWFHHWWYFFPRQWRCHWADIRGKNTRQGERDSIFARRKSWNLFVTVDTDDRWFHIDAENCNDCRRTKIRDNPRDSRDEIISRHDGPQPFIGIIVVARKSAHASRKIKQYFAWMLISLSLKKLSTLAAL